MDSINILRTPVLIKFTNAKYKPKKALKAITVIT